MHVSMPTLMRLALHVQKAQSCRSHDYSSTSGGLWLRHLVLDTIGAD
jgi:hypothetical protein